MNHPIASTVRADDLLRHLEDLRSGSYEGAMSRGAKEVVYRQGINLLRSDTVEILEEANTMFLNGTGNVQMIGPEEDGSGGLVTRFELSWSEQRAARIMRGPNGPLQPVRIVVKLLPGRPASPPLWKCHRLLAVSSHERCRCQASERRPRSHCRVRTASARV